MAEQSLSPDEQIRWLSVAAAIAAISVVGIAIGLGVPLLSIILESRGFSASAIGLNTAVAGIASVVAAPLATPLAVANCNHRGIEPQTSVIFRPDYLRLSGLSGLD